MGTPGWVKIVQPVMATFEVTPTGKASTDWQDRYLDELCLEETDQIPPTLATVLIEYRCDTYDWEYETKRAEEKAQEYADQLEQPVVWQFDTDLRWATVRP